MRWLIHGHVLEEFVNFDMRFQISMSGNGKDIFRLGNNILSRNHRASCISESPSSKAAMAVKIAEQLNLSGTLCVEVF